VEKAEKKKYEPSSGTSPTNLSFTAIVGQEEMKLALILNVIDPKSVAS
jgi:Mg-chelatase subunit ChlI